MSFYGSSISLYDKLITTTTITPLSTQFTSNTLTVAGQTLSFLNGLYTASCSSSATVPGDSNWEPFKAFNGGGGSWICFPGNFNSTTGLYTGTTSTTVSGTSTVGEWIQLQIPITKTMTSYNIFKDTNGATVLKWKVVGSNYGSTWTLIDSQDFTSTPTYWSDKLFSTFPVSTVSYAYYKLICQAVTPGPTSTYVAIPQFNITVFTVNIFPVIPIIIEPIKITTVSSITSTGFSIVWNGGSTSAVWSYTINGVPTTPSSSAQGAATFSSLSGSPFTLVITASDATGTVTNTVVVIPPPVSPTISFKGYTSTATGLVIKWTGGEAVAILVSEVSSYLNFKVNGVTVVPVLSFDGTYFTAIFTGLTNVDRTVVLTEPGATTGTFNVPISPGGTVYSSSNGNCYAVLTPATNYSYTFTAPSTKTLTVFIAGGGGCGGSYGGAGGGGAGGYKQQSYSITSGTSYTITGRVGNGGISLGYGASLIAAENTTFQLSGQTLLTAIAGGCGSMNGWEGPQCDGGSGGGGLYDGYIGGTGIAGQGYAGGAGYTSNGSCGGGGGGGGVGNDGLGVGSGVSGNKGGGGIGISPSLIGIGLNPTDPCYQKYLCGGGGASGNGGGQGIASVGGGGSGSQATGGGGSVPPFCGAGGSLNTFIFDNRTAVGCGGANTGGGGGGNTGLITSNGGSGIIMFSY